MGSVTQYTTQPQLVVPSAAAGVTVTPSGTAWVNSAYVELTAGIANDIILVGVLSQVDIAAFATYNIEIGKGAATSETVAGTILGHSEAGTVFSGMELFGIPIFVAANTRLAVRVRKAGTETLTWTMKLVYYELPVVVAATPAPLLLHGQQYMRTRC